MEILLHVREIQRSFYVTWADGRELKGLLGAEHYERRGMCIDISNSVDSALSSGSYNADMPERRETLILCS